MARAHSQKPFIRTPCHSWVFQAVLPSVRHLNRAGHLLQRRWLESDPTRARLRPGMDSLALWPTPRHSQNPSDDSCEWLSPLTQCTSTFREVWTLLPSGLCRFFLFCGPEKHAGREVGYDREGRTLVLPDMKSLRSAQLTNHWHGSRVNAHFNCHMMWMLHLQEWINQLEWHGCEWSSMPVQDPKFDMTVGRTGDFERPRRRGADTRRKMTGNLSKTCSAQQKNETHSFSNIKKNVVWETSREEQQVKRAIWGRERQESLDASRPAKQSPKIPRRSNKDTKNGRGKLAGTPVIFQRASQRMTLITIPNAKGNETCVDSLRTNVSFLRVCGNTSSDVWS